MSLRHTLLSALATLAISACHHDVRLVVPSRDPASRYTCTEKGCTPATSDVPSELNRAHTLQINLPKECGGQIQQIVVLDGETADVTCASSGDAQPPKPIDTMGGENDGAAGESGAIETME